MKRTADKVITTTCASHCGGTCMLKVHVKDGVIFRIETDDGPEPQIRACAKGRAYRQRVYAPDRLLYPMKRVGERGEGKFERISWDEALDKLSGELMRIRDAYGPASIMYAGSGGDLGSLHYLSLYMRLLFMAGGCTRAWGMTSFQGGMDAERVCYGNLFASNTRDDLLNSKLIILWGWDPATTVAGTNTSWYLCQARESGARIVAVDPRYNESAAAYAQQWIPIRPGTDAAMLIAMAHTMITEDLQDQIFLDTYTFGFDKFRDYVLGVEDGVEKTPAWAEAITGVPASSIMGLAREYATTKPAALMSGIAPGRTAFGEQYHRAAITLAAMTGNVGIHGGSAGGRAWESTGGGYPFRMNNDVLVPNPVDEVPSPPKGSPFLYKSSRVHWAEIPDFIMKGKAGGFHSDCKAVFFVNSNYVNQYPNVNKIVAALKKVEFIAVQEQFMTPTAKFADILLPATTFLERNDIDVGPGSPYYGFVNKAIEPEGECRTHLEIACELADRMGITGFGSRDEEDWLREFVKNSEIPDYEEFKREGIYRVPLADPHVAFKKQIGDPGNNPFRTPSGKIEIYSQQWAALDVPDLPPVPKYIESWEGPNDPLAGKYPLQMITTHFKRRALSQYDNIPWLREMQPQAVTINGADARARGIKNGGTVSVFNDRGDIRIAARVTERIMPGVVEVPHGSWYDPDEKGVDRGGCANVLTGEAKSPSGSFALNTCLVEVRSV